jgi:G:T/U-mismatch repair DNA glycosylase
MPVLPDIRAPGLDVVFCGTAPGERSAERGHYFAGRGNRIWHQIRAAKRWSTLLANNRAKAAVEQLWCCPSSLQLTIG